MEKIVVENDEAVADLIERILEAEDKEVRLVVPKKSHLLDSPNNFRLLAREAQVLQKEISIESVDEDILELAKANGLAFAHPLFDERMPDEGIPMEDIVLKGKGRKRRKAAEEEALAVPLRVEPEPELDDAQEEEAAPEEEEKYESAGPRRSRGWFRPLALICAAALAVFLLLWGFGAAFGRADVNITFKRIPWNFSNAVSALTSVKNVDPVGNVIPGQLFEEEKSLVLSFPASGSANVSVKAQGTITVVNAYSSNPQTLVATTRFQTPDGKIYRLDNQILVPGAQVANGQITPASIKAPVTADQPGPDYNVGKVDKLTIPGFKNTPKFQGFYGVLESGASGGATGVQPVATDADVAAAKQKVNDTLQSAFQTTFLAAIPDDIKVPDGASAIEPGKVDVNRTAGQDGQFTVTATAVFEAFGFRTEDLNDFLNAKAAAGQTGYKIADLQTNFANVSADFIKKTLQFTLTAQGDLVPDFNPSDFAAGIAGHKAADAKSAILALPDLTSAELKLWPAWLQSLPGNSKRIHINLN